MSVKQKYLKDENGNIFSPITSADSVILGGGVQLRTRFLERFLKKCFTQQQNHLY